MIKHDSETNSYKPLPVYKLLQIYHAYFCFIEWQLSLNPALKLIFCISITSLIIVMISKQFANIFLHSISVFKIH